MAGEYLILLSAVLGLFGWLAFRKKPTGLPPGPRPLPLLGNLLQLGPLPHRSLAELARRHGPLMFLRLGLVPYVVVSSSSLAKQVLQKHDQVLSYRAPPDSTRALDHDKLSVVHVPPGATWRSLRKLCNSNIFSSQRLDASQGLRSRKVSELVAFLEKRARAGEAVDVGRAVFTTTLNLISSTIFSEDLVKHEEESSAEFKNLIRRVMIEAGSPNISDYFPLLRWLDLQGRRRRLIIDLQKLKDIIGGKIDDRGRSRVSQGESKKEDFLEALLDAMYSLEFDRATVEALVVVIRSNYHVYLANLGRNLDFSLVQDLFGAGSETSATTVEWAMTELLRNPTILEEARREVAEAMEGRQKAAVEESDIGRMPFLQAIVKETLRLHPPVPFLIPRRAAQTVHLEIDATTQYTIQAGTVILVNAWAIGRDFSVWGPDAGVFRPERFAEGEFRQVDYRGNHMELISFGAGRRICPGLPLASRMVHLILANLILSFDWKLPEGNAPADLLVTENFGITLSKAEPLMALPVLDPPNRV